MLKKLFKLLKWLYSRLQPQPTTIINIYDASGGVVINQQEKVIVIRKDNNNKSS